MLITGTAVAMLGACGDGESGTMSISGDDFVRVAASITRHEDRVTADQLARWIAEDTRDFVIVDVRPEMEFNSGHITGALNLSLPELVSDAGRRKVADSETIVVYSNGSENAAKAAVMLRLSGVHAGFLLGGYNHWGRHILNPEVDAGEVDGELLTFTERRALSCSFCGPEAITGGYRPPLQPVGAALQGAKKESPQGIEKIQKKGLKAIVSEGC